MLGVSKGVSNELICTKKGCQKALAVHASLFLAFCDSGGKNDVGSARAEWR